MKAKKIEKTCSVEGCYREHLAKGLCKLHYDRVCRTGSLTAKRYEQHGMHGTKVYYVWQAMKSRCENLNDKAYKYYGERGIKVCKRWTESFSSFYEDMGEPPTGKHQIDRRNNDGDYTPENCRWATPEENNQNRSSTKLTKEKAIEIKLSSEPVKSLAARYGVTAGTIEKVKSGRTWKNLPMFNV